MKDLKIKSILFYLLLVGIAVSCSKEETHSKLKTVDLKFPSLNDSNARTSEDSINFDIYTVTIKSIAPLEIIPNGLIVVKATDSKTGILLDVIIQNQVQSEKNIGSRIQEKPVKSVRGYVYDNSTNCFLWGTINTYEDGTMTFTLETDPTTQYLMNVCDVA